MRHTSKLRSIFLTGCSLGLLAACTGAEVASPGSDQPIQPVVIVGGGGGTGGFGQDNTPPGACPAGTTRNTNVNLGDNVQRAFCVISGVITGAVSLPNNSGLPYLLDGPVFIGTDGGASGTLTLAAGTRILSSDAPTGGTAAGVDLLVATRGSRLIADGTAAAPIVFTSAQDFLDDGLPNGSVSGRGQWGGIALNGFAPINDCTANPGATGGTAACTKNGEGGSGLYGGANPADNSGTLRFVRIQHAGFQFSSTNELNGLALQGVGNGTILENIQVHNNADDGIEFFGGTVNARNIVLTGNDDDNIDWTDGWIGNLQFSLVVQTGTAGDNGIEADNLTSNGNALPRSNPNVSNVTLISNNRTANSNEGIQVRAGTDGRIINTIVAGFGQGLEFNAVVGAPVPVINSVAFNGNAILGSDADDQSTFNAGANNRLNAASTLSGIIPGPNETATPAINPTTLGAFFTAANYVGAFGGSDTAANNWTSGWTVNIPGSPAPACPVGTTQQAGAIPAGRSESLICRINAPVIGNVTLTRGNLYEIDGLTFVGADRGADPAAPTIGTVQSVLTIEPGVTLFSSGRTNGQDALTVSRGNQIFANGSAAAPVVFTSREFLFTNTGDSGDWNGLTINGRAPINDCAANPGAAGGTVACVKNGEAGTGLFGGATANDNSGRLNFVRVEFAGFQFSGTNEANSVQLQGVGSGTQIDFVQALFGADDGFEWFGGTVNARHLVSVGSEDDSLDWTDGWNGRVQFALVRQASTFAANDNGIEGDNLTANNDAAPRSNPAFSNLTLFGVLGVSASEGIQVRAGTDGDIVNTVVANFTEGLEFNPGGTGPNPSVNSLRINGVTTNFSASGNTLFTAGSNNVTNAAHTLTAPAGFIMPLNPGANETSATPFNPSTLDPFFTGGQFIGAVQGPSDTWYAGWTRGL